MHPNRGEESCLHPLYTFLSQAASSNEEPVFDKGVDHIEECQVDPSPTTRNRRVAQCFTLNKMKAIILTNVD